jgi:hypothetical protein
MLSSKTLKEACIDLTIGLQGLRVRFFGVGVSSSSVYSNLNKKKYFYTYLDNVQ